MDNDLVKAVAQAISGSGVTSPRSIRQAQAAIAAYEAASASRIRELEEALKLVMDAVDKARLVPKPGCGAGGQTIEANIRGSDYLRVDAWQIECARAVLDAKKIPASASQRGS